MHHHQTGAALRSSLITIAFIVLAMGFAFTLLPKGFSGDISKIGQGTTVVVLTHNKNSVQSLELMELMGKIRPDYGDKVEFVVINVEIAAGKTFINRQQVNSSSLLVFDPSGKRLAVLGNNANERRLRLAIEKTQQAN